MEQERLKALADAKTGEKKIDLSFEELNTIGKFKAVEELINTEIRPMLMMDGGDLEIIDIKTADDSKTDIYIRYLGACSGCASGAGGTLFAIESVLKENLSANIRVMPI